MRPDRPTDALGFPLCSFTLSESERASDASERVLRKSNVLFTCMEEKIKENISFSFSVDAPLVVYFTVVMSIF